MTIERSKLKLFARGLVAAVWIAPGLAGGAQTDERSVWDGVYTSAQAQRGEVMFIRSCIACHSNKQGEAGGHGPAPSVMGEDFSFRWTDAAMVDLFDTIRQTMPEAAPNSLSAAEYADLTAYVLKLNNYPSGTAELNAADREALQLIYIDETPP